MQVKIIFFEDARYKKDNGSKEKVTKLLVKCVRVFFDDY